MSALLRPEGIEIAKAVCKEHCGFSDVAGGDDTTRFPVSDAEAASSQSLPHDAIVAALKHMRRHDHATFNSVMKDVYTKCSRK